MKAENRVSRRNLVAAVLVAGALVALPHSTFAQDEADYVLATATTGGTYYPVGVALATLTKVKLQPKEKIGMSAISSAGSGENVRLLRENEAQFAILQGLFGYFAANGLGPVEADGKQENLRSVTMLWQNVEHFLVDADKASTGTIDDFVALKGSAVGLGAKNSGTIGSNAVILGNLGLDIEKDFELMYGGYSPTAEAMQNGQIVGASMPAGVPVGAVTQLAAAMGDGVKLLSFTDEQMAKADGSMGLWTPYEIPAGTYPGQDEAVMTIAQPNFLAVRDDVPEEHVYLFTKTVYENLPFLQAIHPATKAMAIEKAIAGLPMPLHPGAARYYKEVGIEVPENLMAK
jgi:TRAP transporter TAXI family solute receptor